MIVFIFNNGKKKFIIIVEIKNIYIKVIYCSYFYNGIKYKMNKLLYYN